MTETEIIINCSKSKTILPINEFQAFHYISSQNPTQSLCEGPIYSLHFEGFNITILLNEILWEFNRFIYMYAYRVIIWIFSEIKCYIQSPWHSILGPWLFINYIIGIDLFPVEGKILHLDTLHSALITLLGLLFRSYHFSKIIWPFPVPWWFSH